MTLFLFELKVYSCFDNKLKAMTLIYLNVRKQRMFYILELKVYRITENI